MYGHIGHYFIPHFLRANVEFATKKNNTVIVLSDSKDYILHTHNNPRLFVYNLTAYEVSSKQFAAVYKPHLYFTSRDSLDKRKKRSEYEAQCFNRWFVLHEFMRIERITRVFYGDGDNAFFVNIENSMKYRSKCSAMININAPGEIYAWTGAGEASYWTYEALTDFVNFSYKIYSKYDSIFDEKKKSTSIADMSLLWLWWVAHFRQSGWDAGRPFARPLEDQIMFDNSFSVTKSYKMPSVNQSLTLCNGMDVFREGPIRTAFDHMHGWTNETYGFDEELGMGYVIGASLFDGGKPETLDGEEISKLQNQRIYFNSLHYQGDDRSKLRNFKEVCHHIRMASPNQVLSLYDDKILPTCTNWQ